MNGLIINDKIYTLSEVEARLLLHFITETKATSEPTNHSWGVQSILLFSKYICFSLNLIRFSIPFKDFLAKSLF